MYKKLNNDNKRVLSNFFSLSLLQGANYVLPLLTLPYLVRVLDVKSFGLVMFAQALMAYFTMLTDYGFNMSATREISINRENRRVVNEIFFDVMAIKLLLLIISFIILTIIIFTFAKFNTYWYIYYLSFGMVIGQTIFPVWFFQGIEKMKYITILNILSKLIFTISIFIFVSNDSDYYLVPLLNSLGFIISGLISLYLVFIHFNIKFIYPDFKRMKRLFKESSQLFISNISVTLYTASNTVVLGLLTNNAIVGIYASIEKLIGAIKNLYIPLYQALFPWLSKKSKTEIKSKIKKIMPYIAIVGTLFTIVIFIFAKDILIFVYNKEEITKYYKVFQILSLISILASLNMLFNMLYLTSIKAYKERMKIMISSGIINLVMVFILTYLLGIYGTATSITITEFILLVLGFYYYKKIGLQ